MTTFSPSTGRPIWALPICSGFSRIVAFLKAQAIGGCSIDFQFPSGAFGPNCLDAGLPAPPKVALEAAVIRAVSESDPGVTRMGAHSDPFPAGSQAGAALAASGNAVYVACAQRSDHVPSTAIKSCGLYTFGQAA